MKVRTGFVSNSSSTSFIVALDKPFESVEECKLFFNCYQEQAERIFEGITKATFQPYSLIQSDNKDLRDLMISEYESFCYELDDKMEKLIDIFLNNNGGKQARLLTFSDSGDGGDFIDSDLKYIFKEMLENRGVSHIAFHH